MNDIEWEFKEWKTRHTAADQYGPHGVVGGGYRIGLDNVISIRLNPNLQHRLIWVYLFGLFADPASLAPPFNLNVEYAIWNLRLKLGTREVISYRMNQYVNNGGTFQAAPRVTPVNSFSSGPSGGVVKDMSLIFSPLDPITSAAVQQYGAFTAINDPEPNGTTVQPISADFGADYLQLDLFDVLGVHPVGIRAAVQTYAW